MSNKRIDLTQFEDYNAWDFYQDKILATKPNLGIMLLNLIAELKRCYEEMDKVTEMIADFSHRCEQAEYTDVGEVWDLLNALMKNLASE